MSDVILNAGLSMMPEDILPSAWVGHVPFAFWVVEEARPDILVELGTHNGTSFLGLCQAIKDRGVRTKAFAVDTWEGDEHSGHYGEDVHARLHQLVQAKYSDFAQLMRMRFDDAIPYFSDGSIDLLHIDGLHTYEAVKHDFDTWLPKMSRRGVVLFHDTMVREREFGVWRLWEELRGRYPAFEFKHTHGLGVLLVGEEPPAALAALCRLTATAAEASVSNLFGALGQRFNLLDRIGQLDARHADAVQHAANYQAMYVTAEAAMRHAIDSFGPQFEERRREAEAAYAQISGLTAQVDSLKHQADAALRGHQLASGQVVEFAAERDALKQELASRALQLEGACARVSELAVEVDALRLQVDAAVRGLELASGQMVELGAERDALKDESASRSRQLQDAAVQISGLATEVDSLVGQAGAALRGQELASSQLKDRMDEIEALRSEAPSRLLQVRQALGLASAPFGDRTSAQDWLALIAELDARLAQHRALQAAAGVEVARLTRALAQSETVHQLESQQFKDRHDESDQALAALLDEIRHREGRLQDDGARLNGQRLELNRLLSSKSWRITAPMRWMRGRLAAALRGGPAPSYADVLGAPGCQGDEPAAVGGDVPLPVLPASTAAMAPKPLRRGWRVTRPLRRLGSLLRGNRGADVFQDDGFDAEWYLKRYPDVAATGMDAYEHYLSNGWQEGRLAMPPRVETPHGDHLPQGPWWVSLVARVSDRNRARQSDRGHDGQGDAANPDYPADVREEFDAAFYLLQYPDIVAAGRDPYEHYLSHGKAEGRQGARPRMLIEQGEADFDAARESVLVVSHEASRTGAPVLSLNLVQELQKRYNVITLLLGDGPLVEDFRRACVWLVGPMDLRGSAVRAAVVIDQLVDLHPLRFAIVNSIESCVVLEPLARRRVAAVNLVHEFAAYTRPKDRFWNALRWSDQTVFSTPLTRDSARLEFPDLFDNAFAVLPQGRCQLPSDVKDEAAQRREDSRLLAAMRPHGSSDDAFVVLGAGFVQQRKGVDLFIKCASDVLASDKGKNCRFVWIGSGYDPERDMAYSVYLADQLRRAGLDKHVRIIDETFRIESAYRAADLLLLSSRLDPLPNVAIEAMAHGLPVVCFDKTSGIASILTEEGLADQLVARYLDTQDMASKVIDLASSPTVRQRVRARVLEVVKKRFDMRSYVASLERLALAADAQLALRMRDVDEILQSGLFRLDFHGSRLAPDVPLEDVLEFEYLRSWSSDIGRRKPFPGFHPGMYRQARGLAPSDDPLAHFIRAGRPEGNWCKEVIVPAGVAPIGRAQGRVALHVHVYYPEMLADILARLAGNLIRPDLFVSVPDSGAKALAERTLAAYGGVVAEVRVVPNRGRDIGPFLTAFGTQLSGYEVVGHLHTKKSLELNDSAFACRWSTFLLDNLLGGSSRMADAIVGRMLADPSLGLVFPDDPNVVGWSGNLDHARAIGGRMGLVDFPKEFDFPVGTMFWVKPLAIRPLIELALEWHDYPDEPLGYDGTILHAIERLMPLVVAGSGFRSAVTNVPGVTR